MENTELINQIVSVLMPILATALTAAFTYIGTKIKTAIEQKSYLEAEKVNNEVAKQVISDVVQFIQQVYADLDGAEKLQKAITEASAILKEKGINITETEINMLIESSVYGLKQGLNENQTVIQVVSDQVEEVSKESKK